MEFDTREPNSLRTAGKRQLTLLSKGSSGSIHSSTNKLSLASIHFSIHFIERLLHINPNAGPGAYPNGYDLVPAHQVS